jgi:hypothetical protein
MEFTKLLTIMFGQGYRSNHKVLNIMFGYLYVNDYLRLVNTGITVYYKAEIV